MEQFNMKIVVFEKEFQEQTTCHRQNKIRIKKRKLIFARDQKRALFNRMYKLFRVEAKLNHIMSVKSMKYEKKSKDWTLLLKDETLVPNISSRWIMQHYTSDVWHSVKSMEKHFVIVPEGEKIVYAASNNDHVLKIRFTKEETKVNVLIEEYWDGLLLSSKTGVHYIELLDFEWIQKNSQKSLLLV